MHLQNPLRQAAKDCFQPGAQGTIEYLVIIAIVVVISLVVAGLMAGFFSVGSGVSSNSSNIAAQEGLLSLSNLMLSPADGNYVLMVKSLDPNAVTVTDVKVGDGNKGYSQTLVVGQNKIFITPTTNTCVVGQTTTANVTITYATSDGLTKKYVLNNLSVASGKSTSFKA